MIEFDRIPIKDETSIIEARNKIRFLAKDLRFSSMDITKLTIITLELGLAVYQEGEKSNIVIGFAKKEELFGLMLVFQGKKERLNIGKFKKFFDKLNISRTEDGFQKIKAFKYILNPAFEPSEKFINMEKEKFIHLARLELLNELKSKDEELLRLFNDLKKAREEIERWNEELERRIERRAGELEESQAKLIQLEKLISVGQLATGIAHEINNPLCAISGEAQMLLMGKDKNIKNASKIIVEQAERIKTIVENLLEFSRKKKLKLEPLDINNAVEETISLLSYQAKIEKIEIIKELDINLPKVLGISDRIQEVFLNIMLNAVQAMEGKGRLMIRTHSEKIMGYGRRRTDILKLGQEIVVIEFKDTGKGMDEETLKKIFDPFLSTKEKGIGLGLSICYGIIRNHNGIIEVNSKLGEGSAFLVKLPIPR